MAELLLLSPDVWFNNALKLYNEQRNSCIYSSPSFLKDNYLKVKTYLNMFRKWRNCIKGLFLNNKSYLNSKLLLFDYSFACNGESKKILAPIFINSSSCASLGYCFLSTIGHSDFLYTNNVCSSDFSDFLISLKKELSTKYHIELIQFLKIPDYSPFAKYLNEKGFVSDFQKTCVNIVLPNNFNDYTNCLSKSLRQNYRTSLNRLNRENKELKFEVSINTQLSNKLRSAFMKVYISRIKKKGIKWDLKQYLFNRYFNPVESYVSNGYMNFNSYITIDGKIAGFMQGIVTPNNERVIIPRLAINSDYSLYCPGTVLIWKTIEYLITESKIRNLDLSRGDEQYKYVMGGINYYNNDYYIRCNDD